MQKHSHCIPISEVTSRSFKYFTKGKSVEPALGQSGGNTGFTRTSDINYTQRSDFTKADVKLYAVIYD